RRPPCVGALAIGAIGLAMAVEVRKGQAPATSALPFELIGEKGYGNSSPAQDRADDAVETIRDYLHIGAVLSAERQERRKSRINPYPADLAVERLGGRAKQRNLLRHAFGRGDCSALPSYLDVAPFRVGEALEEPVRRIIWSDGAVEVHQHLDVGSRLPPISSRTH